MYRSSQVKPGYLTVRFSQREFQENVDKHGADIIGERIHDIIPPNAIDDKDKEVSVRPMYNHVTPPHTHTHL